MNVREYFTQSAQLLEDAGRSWSEKIVSAAVLAVTDALRAGKPLLVCGNGGSAADAMHISGELVGRFLVERKALRVICLSSNSVVITAWANDYGYDHVFARQVEAYGVDGAVILGISTSGNSRNVIAAFARARLMGMTTIALTGQGGGNLAALTDYLFAVNSHSTPLVQQVHVCLYHYLCDAIEQNLKNIAD